MATAIILVVLCITFVISGIVWAYLLTLGAKWAKVEGVTFSRALFISLVVHAAQSTAGLTLQTYSSNPILLAAWPLGMFVFQLAFLRWAFRSSSWQAVKSWLPTLLNLVIQALIAFLIVGPFIYEAYVIPTNSMAPAILGANHRATCPTCNAAAYTSSGSYIATVAANRSPAFICENHHVVEDRLTIKPGYPDRIVVNKLLSPRRWDAIVFRNPENPNVSYVKRLIGLPGETIQIQDNGIWINGELVSPPDSLRNISYGTTAMGRPITHGVKPLKLANDECFVLGDFTTCARDSRLWTTSKIRPAAPYAVLKSEIIGVATHTYGHRWRSLEP